LLPRLLLWPHWHLLLLLLEPLVRPDLLRP
jgi:hypothetical protein